MAARVINSENISLSLLELKSISSSVPEEQKEREADEQRREMKATMDESLSPEMPDLRLDNHMVSCEKHKHSHSECRVFEIMNVWVNRCRHEILSTAWIYPNHRPGEEEREDWRLGMLEKRKKPQANLWIGLLKQYETRGVSASHSPVCVCVCACKRSSAIWVWVFSKIFDQTSLLFHSFPQEHFKCRSAANRGMMIKKEERKRTKQMIAMIVSYCILGCLYMIIYYRQCLSKWIQKFGL